MAPRRGRAGGGPGWPFDLPLIGRADFRIVRNPDQLLVFLSLEIASRTCVLGSDRGLAFGPGKRNHGGYSPIGVCRPRGRYGADRPALCIHCLGHQQKGNVKNLVSSIHPLSGNP